MPERLVPTKGLRFAVAMFEAEWVEGDNAPHGDGPGAAFAYACESETFKTPPLSVTQQAKLAADLEEFMSEWLAEYEDTASRIKEAAQ